MFDWRPLLAAVLWLLPVIVIGFIITFVYWVRA
jgi:hypothetical protein